MLKEINSERISSRLIFINREQEVLTTSLFMLQNDGSFQWREKAIIENDPIGSFLMEFMNVDFCDTLSIARFTERFGFPKEVYKIYTNCQKKCSLIDDYMEVFNEQMQIDTIQHLRLFQSSLHSLLTFCFSSSTPNKMNTLSTIKKYYLYQLLYPNDLSVIQQLLETRNVIKKCFIAKSQRAIPDTLSSLSNNNLQELEDFLGSTPVDFEETYLCKSLEDICLIELGELLISNKVLRQCKNCGRWFIPSGRNDAEYCDRAISLIDKRTCRMIGPRKNFSNKLQSDPISMAYRKSYKKLHQRLKSTGPSHITQEAFDKWKLDVNSKMQQCRDGMISFTDFESWIESAENDISNRKRG